MNASDATSTALVIYHGSKESMRGPMLKVEECTCLTCRRAYAYYLNHKDLYPSIKRPEARWVLTRESDGQGLHHVREQSFSAVVASIPA